MWWTIGKRVMSVFVILWMTAVGGILGANMLAIIGTQLFIQENKGEYVQPWSHAGWYAGTILLFIASVTGRLRFMNGTRLGGRSTQSAQQPFRTEAGRVIRQDRSSSAPRLGFQTTCYA